jgi:hypothetical protein
VEGFDDFYQLCSMRVYATRKNLRVDFIAHPAAFQYHAAERLMERAIGVDDALDCLGRSLTEWLPFIYHAEGGLMTDGACCAPVRENAGMMVGEFTDQVIGSAIRYDFGRHTRRTPTAPKFFALDRTFMARTFLGRTQLRPAQAHAMKLLSNWRADFGDACQSDSESILWPWSLDDDFESGSEGFESAAAALDQVIENPDFIRSMHASPGRSGSLPSDDLLDLGAWGSIGSTSDPVRPAPM